MLGLIATLLALNLVFQVLNAMLSAATFGNISETNKILLGDKNRKRS